MSESEVINVTANQINNLNDLRQFRLNKKIIIPSRTELLPGKKRLQAMADSDSDEPAATVPKKYKPMDLTDKVKENLLFTAIQSAPDLNPNDIHQALARNNWNTTKALDELKSVDNIQSSSRVKSSSNKTHKRHKHARRSTPQDDEGSDDEVSHVMDQVYDSDDSNPDYSTEMTGQRKKVFDFMNTATIYDLQNVKTLTEKKANLLVEMRPFNNWSDLCVKLDSNKSLSTDLLNKTQDLINKQNNVANILRKCNKMVKRLETAIETGAGIVEQPDLLNSNLKLADYQLIGLNWLVVMHNQKVNGILADEMGLGKTIQIIAFLAYLKENNLARGAHLIVVPSSTLDNWEIEIAKWCPSMVVEKYHGKQEDRRRMRCRYAKHGFSNFDIILTTYNIVAASSEERKMFRVCKAHYVIFDEAHMLKNMTTQRYASLVTINAEMRILLTGTPLQNNLLELMSLLCFVMPSVFSKNIEDIKSLFGKRIKPENSNDGANDAPAFEETQVERAKRIMQPFVLRRLKKDVLNNLPKKYSHVQKIPMTAQQKQYYMDLVEFYSNNKGEICSGERAGVAIMMEMRKIANHPLLMRYYFSDSKVEEIAKRLAKTLTYKKTNPNYIFEELAIKSDFQIWQLCAKHNLTDIKIPDELICNSGKLQHLDTLLPKLKNENHRVLIFSQFTMVLDIIEEYLKIKKFGFCRLDGATAVEERGDLINDFNKDSEIFIFLLSTKAGGIGINLTAADTCIIHDIDFNPYNDKQAEDRCHRVGQKRPVTIYRLVSENTIEEGMLMVAEQKLKLEQEITSNEKDGEIQEQKCVVRLLTMALGLDQQQEQQLSNSLNNSLLNASE